MQRARYSACAEQLISETVTVCEIFDELYPKEMQPSWLKYCMSMKAAKNQDKNWVIKMVLSPKPKLKPNQYLHWEDDGVSILFEVDPITKAKSGGMTRQG